MYKDTFIETSKITSKGQAIFTFLKAVEIVKPTFFVMENVKALGSLEKWASVRNKYLAQAEALGYSVKYSVFPSPRAALAFDRRRKRAGLFTSGSGLLPSSALNKICF